MRSFLIAALCLALTACATQRVEETNETRRAEIHTRLALSYLGRNQAEIALQELDKALQIDPSHAHANNVMGLLQTRLGNFEKAENHFRKSIAADAENGDVHNNYGVFLCERARWDEAEAQFQAAAGNTLYADRARAYLNAGLCLLKKPDRPTALRYMKAAIELDPRFPQALYHLARVNFEIGQPLSARGYMQRFFEVAADSPESLMLAIRVERALNGRDLLAKYLLRLKAKFPDSPEAKSLQNATK